MNPANPVPGSRACAQHRRRCRQAGRGDFLRLPFLLSLLLLVPAPIAISAASSTSNLVWPFPPNAPRVRYVQSITGPADLGIKRPFLGRAYGTVIGQRQQVVLARPFGLALDEDGNLLLTDTAENTVLWFDRANHRCYRWDKLGPYQLACPVAVARQGATFYVADSALPAVLAFDVKGQLRFALTNGLERPVGLAIAGEKLFVADAGAHDIAAFDLSGHLLGRLGRRGTGTGEFNFPTHLASDQQGHLLVTDSMNSRIQILDQAGQPVGVVGSVGDGAGHLSRPKGVAADRFGHLYVADALSDSVQVFNSEGQFLMRFGSAGHEPGEFWLPGGIAISRDNRIYVADTYNRRVQVFQYVGEP